MSGSIPIDKAGRIVLPKSVRDKMRLSAGDELLVEHHGEQVTLRPVRSQATLKKERGIWVYQGERSSISISEVIEHEREQRLGDLRS
jgi:AbrB family looped-hinge helix DNA binding protein